MQLYTFVICTKDFHFGAIVPWRFWVRHCFVIVYSCTECRYYELALFNFFVCSRS